MKIPVLLAGLMLAGTCAAQTIDTIAMHSAPLPAPVQHADGQPAAQTRHALNESITRVIAQAGPDGSLQAVCHVEHNTDAAHANRIARTQLGHKE
ncbi:MAG TPA: hypothetical protein VFN09_01625 [Rhodanobacteraceae bacterium]|nr:hypothetical protein [Rhodanobacteraceae bacterium]